MWRSGRSKHLVAATPGHQGAIEASKGVHANVTQYLTPLGFFFQYLTFNFMVNSRVYELRLKIKPFHKHLWSDVKQQSPPFFTSNQFVRPDSG